MAKNTNQEQQQVLLVLEKPNYEELKTLLYREETYLSSVCGLSNPLLLSRQAKWRPKIFEWFYKIIDHFEYDREVVVIAMDFLDRFQLLHNKDIDGEMYQRAAMSSLYIAIKMNCSTMSCSRTNTQTRRLFYLEEYAELSRGQFTPEDLTEMEMLICKTLNWKLNPIIPTNFLVKLLSLFPLQSSPTSVMSRKRLCVDRSNMQFVVTVIYELARYLIEIAVTSPDISFYLNSESESYFHMNPHSVCYAAILLSMDMISENHLSMNSKESFIQRASDMLQTDIEEVDHLKMIIQHSFIPSRVLEGTLSQEEVEIEIDKLHPFGILREAGILCWESRRALVESLVTEHRRSKRKHPSSPTSPLDQIF